jgi:hypothetical protein
MRRVQPGGGLIGCEPPKMPGTGGLISTRQQEAQAPSARAPGETAIPAASADADQTAYAPIHDPTQVPLETPPAAESSAAGESATPPAPQAPPPAGTPIVANSGLIPVDQIGKAGAQSAAPGQAGARGQGAPAAAARGQSTPAATSGVPPIQLSAGIAVPQSLPTGTQMGVSVDYAIRGALNRSSRYVLVISSEGGGNVEAEVKLATSGTLQDFVPKLRPEDRPFNCRIDEITPGGRRVRASNVAPLQTNY